jgi:hypothetical protein
MNIRPDVEDIQTTRTEKLLAVVLTAFLLLGGIWTYTRIDDVVRRHEPVPTQTLRQNPALQRQVAAQRRLIAAENRDRQALQNLEISREAYRTALDAHKPARRLERAYNAAQSEYRTAERELAAARAKAAAARPAAEAARRSAGEKVESALDRQERDSFLGRLGLVLVTIVFAFWLLTFMRRRPSRWFPLAGSVVAYATILAFVLAADYITDYFDPFKWGIAIVAIIGIVLTLLTYLALQRYLLRRLPQRRVRRRQCPFCGYPVAANTRCEGCGREVVAPCARCEAPRRVGTPHCGTCGATS